MKTVFIAKSERLLCDALSYSCTSLGLKVVGSSTDGQEALSLILEKNPDFIFVDAALSNISGFELVKQLRKRNLHARSIFYVKNHDPSLLREAMSLRVDSLLFAEDDIDELARCFASIYAGKGWLNTQLKKDIRPHQQEYKEKLLKSLTPAQLRILALVSTHKTMPEIAKELFISPHTVNNHIANIRRKLKLVGRGSLLKFALAIKHRLIEKEGQVLVSEMDFKFSSA